jgi:hypothetical protein
MNSEAETLKTGLPGLSLEELEKKYFKNNQNYYPNKQPSTNFEKFELNDKDMDVLKSQMGDQTEEEMNADPEVAIVGEITDNRVNMQELRDNVGHPVLVKLKKMAKDKNNLAYSYLLLNFMVLAWTFPLWLWYFSFSLLFCSIPRIVLGISLALKAKDKDKMLEIICSQKGWITKCDITALIWIPIKGMVLTILMPHDDWTPLAEYAQDHFPGILTFVIVGNFFLQKKIAK